MAIHTRIDDALHRNVRDLDLEPDAKLFYETVTSDLGFTLLDHQVVQALSWEWKDRPLYRDHPYACRSWDIIACLSHSQKENNLKKIGIERIVLVYIFKTEEKSFDK